ncbi:MAG: ATP-binding cassette domain-containing protein [Gammaproteobacteria bacterium]|nr:MAG: ATP-binding cassette domain-containing protein [Gammaproteobacteria bacterium]
MAAQGVWLHRGGRRVLEDVSVGIEPGTVTAVAGPNGSGKSSLLAVLAGDLLPAAGRVHLHGRALNQWSDREQACRRAVMLQDSVLAFDLPVATVVALGLVFSGDVDAFSGKEVAASVADVLAEVGLANMAERPYTRLSGGERQRVHLARALIQCRRALPPGCLLLDEPTASLDLKYQRELLRLARAEADHGAAVMLILHDLNQVTAVADRVLLLAEGRTRYWGDVAGFFDADLLSRAYDTPLDVLHRTSAPPLVVWG